MACGPRMRWAAAGRVVPGPLAKDGAITLPISVAVTQGIGGESLYSNTSKYQVSIAKSAGATQFIFSDANVTFPQPAPGAVQVLIGFDEGPPKKGGKKAEEPVEEQSMFPN